MAVPDQQFDLGTAALNGADGDTAREAATKYNAHVHQTADVQDALDGAAAPSSTNVFATMNDLGGTESIKANFNQVTHGLSVGEVAYLSAPDTFTKAKADSDITAEVIGIVSAVEDADNFTLLMGGKINGLTGLTGGALYFLSDTTAGAVTSTEPTASGSVSKPLFVAINATEAIWLNLRGVVIS